jgi:hypothetical protein
LDHATLRGTPFWTETTQLDTGSFPICPRMDKFSRALCRRLLEQHDANAADANMPTWRTRIAAATVTRKGLRLWSPELAAVITATPRTPTAWTVTVHKLPTAPTDDPDLFLLVAMTVFNPRHAPSYTRRTDDLGRSNGPERRSIQEANLNAERRWATSLLELILQTAAAYRPADPYSAWGKFPDETRNPWRPRNPYAPNPSSPDPHAIGPRPPQSPKQRPHDPGSTYHHRPDGNKP